MAKVVKFCAACEEGFAEKFGFCPNCGGALAAYEMNPLVEKSNVGAAETVEARNVSAIVNEPLPIVVKNEPVNNAFLAEEDELLEIDGFPQKETATVASSNGNGNYNHSSNGSENGQNGHSSSNGYQKTVAISPVHYVDDGGYHITFVEEKGSSYRNMLLLGAFMLVTAVVFATVIASMFGKALDIGSLNSDDSMLANIVTVDPEPIEPEPQPKKNNDDGGGGGGGGNKSPIPVSKGVLASQSEKPMIAPSVTMDRVTNPAIPIRMETKGDRKEPVTNQPYGSVTGGLTPSDGPGQGGGQGSGKGRGQGGGLGDGAGNGNGSGNGNGNGNGNGDGDGDGDGRNNPPPPPVKPKPAAGPTIGVQIISKPKATYTDAARQNNVQGVVRLKVTFLASGQIGGVSPVSGLSYGLTEQAISAAKQIRFEPAKVNGVPQTVSKTVEYSFTMY